MNNNAYVLKNSVELVKAVFGLHPFWAQTSLGPGRLGPSIWANYNWALLTWANLTWDLDT